MKYDILLLLTLKEEAQQNYSVVHYAAENEIQYIIVTATERGDREEHRIGFTSLTFQNPEEGGNKSPKRRFLNKKIV